MQFQLRGRLPHAQVFIDVDSIEPGLDFAEVIRDAVGSCAVLPALVGRQWLTLTDESGNRRLDDPDDYVRLEVQTALDWGVRVIPVLVDGAQPLRRHQLPVTLQKLSRLNALELSYGRYQYDADRLMDIIQRVLAVTSSGPAVTASVVTKRGTPRRRTSWMRTGFLPAWMMISIGRPSAACSLSLRRWVWSSNGDRWVLRSVCTRRIAASRLR